MPVPAKKKETAAFVPPDGADEGGGSGTDYAAVTARYLGKIRNPMTAIRAKCIQCCNGQVKEVTLCTCTICALYPFRMGVNPHHKRRKDKAAKEADDDGSDDAED